jgi:predicted transcriptional regulator
MKLTPNEVRVLQAIDASEYGDFLQDAVWTFSVTQECGVAAGSVAGVVSSLVKKGLLKASSEGADATLRMTDSGAQTYVKIMDGITRKHAICTHCGR